MGELASIIRKGRHFLITNVNSLQPQTCVQEHCPGETGLPSSVFPDILKCFLVGLLLFKVMNYLPRIFLEGNNAVSIRKG